MPVSAPSTIATTSVSQSKVRMLNWGRGIELDESHKEEGEKAEKYGRCHEE